MLQCFQPAEIMLPDQNIDLCKWAVIACDQYTSQKDYWSAVEQYVGSAQSTLHIVYPEIYLGKDSGRTGRIQNNMEKYLKDGTLKTVISSGYVLVERRTESGIRIGLIGQVDLEQYDFRPEGRTLIRATEETILSRIPPRVEIRKNAKIECPHAMLLMDDSGYSILDHLYEKREKFRCVYDTELMLGGGHIRGFAIENEYAEYVTERFGEMERECGGFLFAVGDGNHSLAVAKICWENIKKGIGPGERQTHPARYALVEIVSLHSPALRFGSIHRILFHTEMSELIDYLERKLKEEGMELAAGDEIVFMQGEDHAGFSVVNRGRRLPVEILQKVLDSYLKKHGEARIDYIHDAPALREVIRSAGGCGIRLQPIDRTTLFPAIRTGNVLPRKTFSIGAAWEKRYYMECKMLD